MGGRVGRVARTVTALLVLAAPALGAQSSGPPGGRTDNGASAADSAAADSVAAALARADSIRQGLVQPPGSYGGVRTMDVIRLPFQLFGATLSLGLSAVGVGYVLADKVLLGPALRARESLADVQIDGTVDFIGSRSWPAVVLRYVGMRPFFVEAGYSVRQYELYRAGFEVGDDTTGAHLTLTRHELKEPHFYGVGPETRGERADYAHDLTSVDALGWSDLGGGPVSVNAGVGWERNGIGRGADDGRSDLHDLVAPGELFGLEERTEYVRVQGGAVLDRTHVRHLQVRGARLAGDWAWYHGVGGTPSEFHRVAGDLSVFVPANARQLVALRVMAEDHLGEDGRGVPFFHKAGLGDDDGLRGYSSRRFRDDALLAAQLEWRYEAWWHPGNPNLRGEAFVFLDSGTVGPSLGDIDFAHLRATPGLGLRFIDGGRSYVEGYVAFGGGRARWDVEFGRTF